MGGILPAIIYHFDNEGTPKYFKDTWAEIIEGAESYKNKLEPFEREVFDQIHEHLTLRYKRSTACYKASVYRDIPDIVKEVTDAHLYNWMEISMDGMILFHAFVLHRDEVANLPKKK